MTLRVDFMVNMRVIAGATAKPKAFRQGRGCVDSTTALDLLNGG
jgi:hypothetical protein